MKQALKNLTAQYCPFLYDIIKNKESIWDKVSNKFEEKLEIAKDIITNKGQILTENSLPILLGKAEEGDSISKDFLKFIDSEIKYLFDSSPIELKEKTVGLCKRLFLEFDTVELSKPNPTYLNGVAEILVINKLIKSGEYTLLSIEENLSNGKSADFLLKKNETNEKSYVEVFNIHVDDEKVSNFEDFKTFIDKRIEDKYSNKTSGLDGSTKQIFFLCPVIWSGDSIASILKEYDEKFSLQSKNILNPCSLVQIDCKGTKYYHFGLNNYVR
ncbi:MAG: hypothetical protein LBP67_04160 [Bacteroidales bacterium]|jgi:hypothetical protein|nr:hypothetical protein [Bacteroidales bacterium]